MKRLWPKGPEPIRGDVFLPDFVVALRMELGLPPNDPAPGELAASRGQPLPTIVEAVDLGALMAWTRAGLGLLTTQSLTMDETVTAARRVAVGLAMERAGGNLTQAAAALGMSRRACRECLRRVGLYEVQHDDDSA